MRNRRASKLIEVATTVMITASFATSVIAGANAVQLDGAISESQTQELWTPVEQARLGERALTYLRRLREARKARLRVLGIKRLPAEKETVQRFLVSAVVFNYSQGIVIRLIIDPSNGAVLHEEHLRGRPQASEDERQEARQIIRTDLEHARMLENGGILEGGFVVDAPAKHSMRDRFIQFQILTADRQGLQRVVVVNLTTGGIAESRQR
ncbi:MAG: hypothetical protein WAO00_16965 [Chthoniobacterales bacterium]